MSLAPAIEVPPILPGGLRNLSHSSISKYLKCPESWRQSYLEGNWEPSGGAAILGSAVHAANAEYYRSKLYGSGPADVLSLEDVLDCFASSWEVEVAENEIDWRDDKPGDLKDAGIPVLKRYHQLVAHQIDPVHVEREFRVQPQGVEWAFKGFIDLEYQKVIQEPTDETPGEVETGVIDYKVLKRAKSQADCDSDLQPTMYLLARRAEGAQHQHFKFHTLNRTAKTEAAMVKVMSTERTGEQLDRFYTRVLSIAAEIAWRAENDVWQGAVPGSWWCSSAWCSHWDRCGIR